MKEIKISTVVRQCTYNELDESDRHLVDSARRMTRASLALYSHFHVGAAIMMENGEIVCGSNQENAAYPSGICAERTAAFYASARFPGVAMKKIAIAAWTREGLTKDTPEDECFLQKPISPCGACRQALLEYEKLYGQMEVILYGAEYCYIFPSIASLLPYCFTEFP